MSKSKEYKEMYNELNWKEQLSYYSDFFWLFFDAMPKSSVVVDYYLKNKYPVPITISSEDESKQLIINFELWIYGLNVFFDITNKSNTYYNCVNMVDHIRALTKIDENLTYDSDKFKFRTRLLTPSVIDKEECQWEWAFIDKYGISSSFIVTNKQRAEIYDRYINYEKLNDYYDIFDPSNDPIDICLKLGIQYRDVIDYFKNERRKYEEDS